MVGGEINSQFPGHCIHSLVTSINRDYNNKDHVSLLRMFYILKTGTLTAVQVCLTCPTMLVPHFHKKNASIYLF